MALDIDAIQQQFPALALQDRGMRRVYFDNPAGTQVPQCVVNAMADCMLNANANLGGPFSSSQAAGEIVDGAHTAMADLLNAADDREIVFGANMTSLTFQLSRALIRQFDPGDEIIISEIDHDANVTPWVLAARDNGLVVHKIPLDTGSFELDLERYNALLSPRTRLVCVAHASNLLGTINDITAITDAAHEHGALVFIDAVHSVPHVPVDVQAFDCDFLVCSPYKFFGPHQGVLWGRQQLLDSISAYKLRPAPDDLPGRFETGTQSHEGMAGVQAAVDYLARLGNGGTRREQLRSAMNRIRDYEAELCTYLLDGLHNVPGLTIYGISDDVSIRTPTISFRLDALSPAGIARELAGRNIFAWSGHSYAVEPCTALGLMESGGVLRVGLVHYNDRRDIDVLLQALGEMAAVPRAGSG